MHLLTWRIEKTEETALVHLAGELDIAGITEAQEAVRTAEEMGKPLLVLDLSGLTFMDSNGIHLLLTALGRAKNDSHNLALIPGRTRRLLELSGVLPLFELLEAPTQPLRD